MKRNKNINSTLNSDQFKVELETHPISSFESKTAVRNQTDCIEHRASFKGLMSCFVSRSSQNPGRQEPVVSTSI